MQFSGHLSLRAERRPDGRSVLAGQSFRAPFHVSKSYWDGHALLVQVVNPTAGVLEGDQLESEIEVNPGAALLVTSPSATRVFHMKSGAAESRQRFKVNTDGWLEFWPEPLVPHAHSEFTQSTRIEVAPGGRLIFGDFLIPGRLARGEAWGWRRLVLDLRLQIGPDLVLRERIDQSGAEMAALAGMARKENSAAMGTILAIAPELADEGVWKDSVAALHCEESWVGVSRLRGVHHAYSIKLIASDGECLRRTHRRVREIVSVVLPRLKADARKL